MVFVIPEGAGLCQHVSDQWFCWLSASVRAAPREGPGSRRMHRVHKEQTNIPIPWSIIVTLPESDKGSVQASSKLLTSKLNCSITSSDGNVLASNNADSAQGNC